MEEEVIARKKAELILGGNLRIDKDIKVGRYSKSSAGPGAGSLSVALSFDGKRVKKNVSDTDYEFELKKDLDIYVLTRDGEVFLEDVWIEPILFHCPQQAFFDLLHGCIFNCAYCTSPLIPVTRDLTDDEIVRSVRDNESKIKAIALTSGIRGSVSETVDRMVGCVERLRKEFPDKPIGVEPYVESEEQIKRLKLAGADEIKINMECATKELFVKACPELEFENIFKMLAHSIEIFGKGHVMSNIIVGLGETKQDVECLVTLLCMIGVAPVIRVVKRSPLTKERMERLFGEHPVTADQMIDYAKMQKQMMKDFGLDARDYRTMCFECGCCDIVPFRDL